MKKWYKVLESGNSDGITRRSDDKIFLPGEEAELELTAEEEKTLLDMKVIEPSAKKIKGEEEKNG